MKKLLLVLAAAFAMVACQTDINEVGVATDGVATVEFEVGAPQMRAYTYSLGQLATNLKYAVYDADGKILSDLTVTDAEINGKANVKIELANNKSYSIIFWAEADNAPYTVDFANKTVAVNYTGAACNDESRDAFYAYLPFEVKGAATLSVELRRPFAQVNVGTTDLAAALASGFEPKSSSLKVMNVFSTLNLVDGTATNNVNEVTFGTADIPAATETFPVDGNAYMAMSYVLVGKDKGSYDVTYTITAKDNTVINNTIGAVPMQANYRTNIYGKLLTSTTDINVEIKPGFDGNEGVETPSTVSPANTAELQAALDSAVNRSTIQLKAGVNYGVVYLRPYAGGTATNNVDWVGNNYGWETYTLFENLTIIGAEGATIDAVVIEGGTYYHTNHSQIATYPVMLSLVELKNVVFDGVTFIGNGNRYGTDTHGNAVSLAGNNIKVDGLTFKNCVLKDDTNNNRLLYKSESTTHVHNYVYNGEEFTFTPSLKNITITDCTFDGGYMGLELREAENVTITNNVFKVADRNILLPVNTGCTYSGAITITGNTSINAKERFVRADGTGDAVVVIKNNRILGYQGADADYIKVTGGNNVTIEDNKLAVATVDELEAALQAGGELILANDIALTKTLPVSNANFTLDGNGCTISQTAECENTYALFDITGGKATIKNIVFDGVKEGAVVRTVGVEFLADGVTAQNGQHTQQQGLFRLLGKSTIKNSIFKNNTCSMVISLNYDGANNDPQVVENCVFENNTCSATAVVYYVKGAGATINGNKFVGNTVTVSSGSNAATLYMGFTENNVITNNLFKNNTVNAGTSKRVSGGLMLGYEAIVSGNAFIGNKVNGTVAKGNDVCASIYYTSIDLSGNYWGGNAPVEDDDYFVEYPDSGNSVIVNDYLTENPIQ